MVMIRNRYETRSEPEGCNYYLPMSWDESLPGFVKLNKSVQNHTWSQPWKRKSQVQTSNIIKCIFSLVVYSIRNKKNTNITTIFWCRCLVHDTCQLHWSHLVIFEFLHLGCGESHEKQPQYKSPQPLHFTEIHVNYCPVSNYKQSSVCTFKIMLWQNYPT